MAINQAKLEECIGRFASDFAAQCTPRGLWSATSWLCTGPSLPRPPSTGADAGDYPGAGYDLVCIFDALHDMGDPLGAARHIHQSLADGGTWLLVEPMAMSPSSTT